jgi:alkylhydroperoxidase family enzyme
MLTGDKKYRAHRTRVDRVLEGEGMASPSMRRAAFDNTELTAPLGGLVDKVARQPARITDDDIADVTASGLSEDQIFELVVCAALGQATRQYEAALAALAEATGEEAGEHAA